MKKIVLAAIAAVVLPTLAHAEEPGTTPETKCCCEEKEQAKGCCDEKAKQHAPRVVHDSTKH